MKEKIIITGNGNPIIRISEKKKYGGPSRSIATIKGIKSLEPFLTMLAYFHLIEGCSSTVRSGLAKLAFEVTE
jgi:hypothetical protein